ncbi:MAG: gamma carbonic anhydrase family protein [Candidatus Omnitrophica bacterium]|nr:gamma carbonic anhydrase family protein [Candidatus Omnitrophota bacterium]
MTEIDQILTYKDKTPVIGEGVFIAPGARVVGDVTLKKNASIWYNAVLRADLNAITIGENTNVQDGAVLHVDRDAPCILGDNVIVGHSATVHGAVVEDQVLIGIGATVLSHARIGKGSVVGAGALIKEGQEVLPGSLVVGVPARLSRKLSEEQQAMILDGVKVYLRLKDAHASGQSRLV